MSHQQSPNPNLTSELLAEHVGWMRALARRLVADEHAADDVVQDAMVRALERPPHEQGRLRGWLSTVVRNLSSEGHRSGDNRAAREAAGAREDVLPATDELVDRFQVGQRVAGLLMSLDEPYRTVLLHRFYEELPPREIAKRRGVPVATVKSQIQRGLAKLRERLDGDFGDRRSWLLAVLPLAQPPAAATLGAGAAVTTATAIKLLLAAGLIVSFGSWWMMRDVESEPAGLRESIELVAQAPRSSRPAPAAGSIDSRRPAGALSTSRIIHHDPKLTIRPAASSSLI
ncbi:MAG: RNA polymerase sigma factor, partial [Planctomycetota bacterium]